MVRINAFQQLEMFIIEIVGCSFTLPAIMPTFIVSHYLSTTIRMFNYACVTETVLKTKHIPIVAENVEHRLN